MAPPRMNQKEWARRNPPMAGETREDYIARYYDDTEPTAAEGILDAASNFARGGALGLAKTGTSLAEGVGELTGAKSLRNWARGAERGATEFLNPQGTSGKVGEFVGRAAGEIGTAMTGGGLVAKGLVKGATMLPKATRTARALTYLGKGVEEGGALRRALSNVATSLPIDVVQGLAQDEGMIIPGKTGAALENVVFSGAGGLISGASAAKAKKLRAYESADRVGPFQATPIPDPSKPYGPFQASPVRIPGEFAQEGERGFVRTDRLLPARSLLTAGEESVPTSGQVFAMPGKIASPADRGVAVAPYRNAPATPVSSEFAQAGEEVSKEIQAARREFDALPEWQKKMIQEEQLGSLEDVSDAEISEFLARTTMRGGAAPPEELVQSFINTAKAAQRSSKIPKITASKKKPSKNRKGAADAQILSSLAGGVTGAGYGAATGETEEERLARALAFGGLGAGVGLGAARVGSRFFGEGATSRAQTGQAIREEQGDILRQARQDLRAAQKRGAPAAEPLTDFPPNREPLEARMGKMSAAERMIFRQKVQEFEPLIQRPRTEAEFRKTVAKLAGEKDLDFFTALDPKKATAEEAGAVLALHRDLRSQIGTITEQIKKSADPAEIERLTAGIDQMDDFADRLLQQVMRMDTEAGRSLQSRRYMAMKMDNPEYWHLKAAKLRKDLPLTLDQKSQIDKLVASKDSEGLLKYMASIQRSSIPEQIAAMRSAGLLAGVPGRIRDLMSTGGNYAITTLQRFGGAGADALLSKVVASRLGGTADKFRTVAMPTALEMKASLGGAAQGMQDAAKSMGWDAAKQGDFRAWVQSIRDADLDADMIRRLELPFQTNIDMMGRIFGKPGQAADTFLDTYAKLAMRTSGVTDKVLRGAAMEGALVEQVTLEAKRRGLKGAQASEFIQKQLTDPSNIDDELKANAALAANYITFTNDGFVADAISNTIEAVASRGAKYDDERAALVRAGARILLPFRRTPANILTRAVEYTPGAGTLMTMSAARDWTKTLLNASIKEAGVGSKLAQQQRRLVDLAMRQVTGLGMVALGAKLYQDGILTGEYPKTPQEQEQWRLEGKRPESIMLGGEWRPIGQITPFGNIMTMGASIMHSAEAEGETPGGIAEAVVASPLTSTLSASRSLLNQPMVQSPREALDALTGASPEGPEGYVRQLAGSFIPTFVGQAARADGTMKAPQSIVESVQARIPGLAEGVPERLNIFGEPVVATGGLAENLLSPLAGTPDMRQRDPLVRELSDVGVEVAAMRRKKGESFELYQYRQREAGKFVKEDLAALFQDPEYQNADRATKARMISTTVREAREALDSFLRDTYNITPEE